MTKIIKLASIATISSTLLLLSMNSQAEIYKWVDENGGVHYTAQPPAQQKKRVKAKNIEDEIKAAAGKYRPPANDTSKKDDDNETDAEKVKVGGEELSGPDNKLVSYCNNQKKNLEQLKKNFRNVWIDIKGKKTNLDQEQRKEKVVYLQQRIAEDCKEVK